MSKPRPLQAVMTKRWARWINRRIPPMTDITLNQRRIFIFLTRPGGFMALLLLCLFIAGINYANNLLLGLCFLLGSLSVIAIHHTFGNLSGLRIQAVGTTPAFAGEAAGFTIRLSDPKRRRHDSLRLIWSDASEWVESVVSAEQVTLYLKAERRGRFHPPRLKIITTYPLGLLQAWTWLDLDLEAVVYPRPVAGSELPAGGGDADEADEGRRRKPGQEDFESLKTFTPGDPLAHVSWKHLARGQGMLVKVWSEPIAGSDTLDYQALAGMDRENRLSRLAWWVEKLHTLQQPFALRLPGVFIPVGQGARHREECLTALALFEAES
jgi:uncharacterized protein (DUF58 family)